MKPRLESAPLTLEDSFLWHRLACKWSGTTGFTSLWVRSMDIDSSDAELMFQWRRWRKMGLDCEIAVPNPWWLKWPDDELRWQWIGGQLS